MGGLHIFKNGQWKVMSACSLPMSAVSYTVLQELIVALCDSTACPQYSLSKVLLLHVKLPVGSSCFCLVEEPIKAKNI